jgi:hypothetical protein
VYEQSGTAKKLFEQFWRDELLKITLNTTAEFDGHLLISRGKGVLFSQFKIKTCIAIFLLKKL